jgi:eukaryotic-like serine/threonine-protein kinase
MPDAPSRLAAALADRYRLERELGQGGMATVYLAQDLRHDRMVAIKVLRPELAAVIGAERFLSEIKTTANLQHPHILPLFDSGAADSFLFYVMPFIEGESLRDRLNREKQLPIADAVRIATEVAGALDYAHRHNVIHRDIKPENILLHDGRALVADFGIALAASKAGGSRMTETGMSLGTPTYMSPEQAMGEREITARSDVYALGAMTYEMLIGEPPFTGPTAQAIVAKVMTAEPTSLIVQRKRIPPQVEEAVLTALEKLPADRFASAAEFAASLAGQRGTGAVGRQPRGIQARRLSIPQLFFFGLLVAVAAFLLGRGIRPRASSSPGFTEQTFRKEAIIVARFAHDGQTMVYSAMTGGGAPRLFILRPDNPEPEPLGPDSTHLLAVSSQGELAVLTGASHLHQRICHGTLARMPAGGGAPREIMQDVREADWSPDGSQLAVIHVVNGKDRLEYPAGHMLVEWSGGYLSDPRVSPQGDRIAYFEHSGPFLDDRGVVAIVDLNGKITRLSDTFWGLEGLAWTPDGRRVLFSAATGGLFFKVYQASPGNPPRPVLPSSGSLILQDVSSQGRWLVSREDQRYVLMFGSPAERGERDLSWLTSSFGSQISRDGSEVLLTDGMERAGTNYGVVMRKTDGSPVVQLGEGAAFGLAPDGRWVLAGIPSTPPRLMLYPTGAGQPRKIEIGAFESFATGQFLPDGQSIVVCGSRPAQAAQCYTGSVDGGIFRAVTPPGSCCALPSPDGRQVVAQEADGSWHLYSINGGAARPVPGLTDRDNLIGWSPDGRALRAFRRDEVPAEAVQVGLATGRRAHLLSLAPRDRAVLEHIRWVSLADDPKWYAYSYTEKGSRLYTVEWGK